MQLCSSILVLPIGFEDMGDHLQDAGRASRSARAQFAYDEVPDDVGRGARQLHSEITVVVLVNNLLSDDQWSPEFGLLGSEMHDGTDIGQAREIESGRRYADYRHACTAEVDAFADHGRITSKPARPQFMTGNDDLFVPKGRVFRDETTA